MTHLNFSQYPLQNFNVFDNALGSEIIDGSSVSNEECDHEEFTLTDLIEVQPTWEIQPKSVRVWSNNA